MSGSKQDFLPFNLLFTIMIPGMIQTKLSSTLMMRSKISVNTKPKEESECVSMITFLLKTLIISKTLRPPTARLQMRRWTKNSRSLSDNWMSWRKKRDRTKRSSESRRCSVSRKRSRSSKDRKARVKWPRRTMSSRKRTRVGGIGQGLRAQAWWKNKGAASRVGEVRESRSWV